MYLGSVSVGVESLPKLNHVLRNLFLGSDPGADQAEPSCKGPTH